MWYFQSTVDEDRKFIVLPGKDYVLGRRDCDIVIENDQSVSRKHAILTVAHPEANVANVNKPASITLRDVSKFGTFVNNKKFKGEKVLQSGDEVRFGTPKSVHRVVYEPFVITTSCVSGPAKNEVRSLVASIGGHVTNDWRKDCGVLVMKTLTVTIKVVCALVSQKPIVTVDYLRDLHKHLKGEAVEKPKPEKYLPPVMERLVHPDVSFHPAAQRASVFLGMSFYFLSEKQFQKMSLVVELGGGVPILSDNPKVADLEAFLEDKTVVMNPAGGDVAGQKDWIEKVRGFLEKKGKHMVQDAEVGYAVLCCSTDDYCNPDKDVSHLLSIPLQSHTFSQAATLESQVAGTDTQAGRHPPIRKPEAIPTGSRNAAASSKNVDSSLRQGAGSRGKDKPSDGGHSSPVESKGVFRVPESESLVEETSGRKGAARAVGGRSRSPAPVQSVKEEPGLSESSLAVLSKSGDARAGRSMGKVTGNVSAEGRETRSRSRSPVGESTAAEASGAVRRQTRSRSPVSVNRKVPAETAFSSGRQTRSRSPAKPFVVPDTERSPTVSQPAKHRAPAAVKVEGDAASTGNLASAFTAEVLLELDSEFDSEMPAAPKIKREQEEVPPDSKPIISLDDEDDDVIEVRKPAPSRNKRRHHNVSSDEDEDNPFDFVKKRPRKSPSPTPKPRQEKPVTRSPSPAPESRPRSPSPAPESRPRSPSLAPERRHKKAPRSASPVSGSRGTGRGASTSSGRGGADDEPAAGQVLPSAGPAAAAAEAAATTKPRSRTTDRSPPPPSAHTHTHAHTHSQQGGSSSGSPVPRGFLTTRRPIKDQVEVSARFERENFQTPAILVEFEDLVTRRTEAQAGARAKAKKADRRQREEDPSDALLPPDTALLAPQGMARWRGRLVRNVKRFSKVKHVGADRLPTIIGGRDLEAHCGETRKVMEDWLRELTEAEGRLSQQEKEAEELFNWQPSVARGGRRRR